MDGAKFNSLHGLRFVVSGDFPELESGSETVKTLITDFGGRVNVSVSNLTNVLVVGNKPAFKKVRQARIDHIPIVSFQHVMDLIYGRVKVEDLSSSEIKEFSEEGYEGKGLAASVSRKEYEWVACG